MTAHAPALIKEVSFSDLRLPYVPEVEVFGIDNVGWKVLIDTVFPSAMSLDAIIMALTYCRRRNLDVFKRVVHIVPMWNTAKRATVETVWPGIAELRTTAFRTGQYGGCDEAEFGPTLKRLFQATHKQETREVEVVFPEWCRITTYRFMHGERCKFVGPKVYWLESYGRWKGTEVPNDMWAKRSVGQIEKCAEAASLRRAFPEEIGNELTAEEMEGQRATGEIGGFEVPERVSKRPNPALIGHQIDETVSTADAREGERVERQEDKKPARRPNPNQAPAPKVEPPQKEEPKGGLDLEQLRSDFLTALHESRSEDNCKDVWGEFIEPVKLQLPEADFRDLSRIYRNALGAFARE